MQLVERPQIAMAERLGIHPSGAEGIFDPLEYRPIAVIALNIASTSVMLTSLIIIAARIVQVGYASAS
jgi:hypothetical protein